jgi:hypothetical protein
VEHAARAEGLESEGGYAWVARDADAFETEQKRSSSPVNLLTLGFGLERAKGTVMYQLGGSAVRSRWSRWQGQLL